MKKINNKGFTLIEVLAVLVILSIIMAIAIPSISSSMERSKEKQNESKKKMLASYAEIYVSDNKNAIHKTIGEAGKCYIAISTLKNNGYLSDDANIDADGNNFIGAIVYDSNNNSYEYKEKNQVEDLNINACGDIIDSNETTNTETITISPDSSGDDFYFAKQTQVFRYENQEKFVFKDADADPFDTLDEIIPQVKISGLYSSINDRYFCTNGNDIATIDARLTCDTGQSCRETCQKLYKVISAQVQNDEIILTSQLIDYNDSSFIFDVL